MTLNAFQAEIGGDTISYMPSSVCKTDLSITSERPAWSKFLPKKVNEKRQQNYEKRVLKKIQEDALEQLPKCDDFPSFKVRIITRSPLGSEKLIIKDYSVFDYVIQGCSP